MEKIKHTESLRSELRNLLESGLVTQQQIFEATGYTQPAISNFLNDTKRGIGYNYGVELANFLAQVRKSVESAEPRP